MSASASFAWMLFTATGCGGLGILGLFLLIILFFCTGAGLFHGSYIWAISKASFIELNDLPPEEFFAVWKFLTRRGLASEYPGWAALVVFTPILCYPRSLVYVWKLACEAKSDVLSVFAEPWFCKTCCMLFFTLEDFLKYFKWAESLCGWAFSLLTCFWCRRSAFLWASRTISLIERDGESESLLTDLRCPGLLCLDSVWVLFIFCLIRYILFSFEKLEDALWSALIAPSYISSFVLVAYTGSNYWLCWFKSGSIWFGPDVSPETLGLYIEETFVGFGCCLPT